MWSILNSTVEITTAQVRISEYVIRKYSKPENQAQQVELYEVMRDVTWALFASHKALNSITIKYKNGFVQAFHRDPRDNSTYYIYSDLTNYTMAGPYDVNTSSSHQGWNDQTIHSNISAIWYREVLNPDTGEKIGKQKAIPPDELINIAGISQVPYGAASWHVAVSKFTNSPLLSAAMPVRDAPEGSIVAVVGQILHTSKGSHELRTPMAAVIGLLDILISDDGLTNEQYATVSQIRRCSTALLRLLNNILDISKVESGKLVLEEAEFDMGRELEGLFDMFSVQCKNHHVEAVIDLSDDMPKVVQGDSARVVQIFANLISNSIKFTTCKLRSQAEWESVFESLNKRPTTTDYVPPENYKLKYADHNLKVVLALNGSMGRMILSRWLMKIGVPIWDASEWNELTHILQELFIPARYAQNLTYACSKVESLSKQEIDASVFIIVIDIGLLNLSTDIWMEQLNFLDTFNRKAKFAWVLNHDTSNTIKMELHNRGHLLMVNEPLYKAKMIQIMEAAIKEKMISLRHTNGGGDTHEFLEIESIHSDQESSNDSEKTEINSPSNFQVEETRRVLSSSRYGSVNNCFIDLTEVCSERNKLDTNETVPVSRNSSFQEKGIRYAEKGVTGNKSLEGIRILLAEDTPILQKVATIMLEKMGAIVVVVGDGLQVVEALQIPPENGPRTQTKMCDPSPYDLILMDCQMPKMDGYEATKAIRRAEMGTKLHIPIVALTAHAMSSDEAKCLEVGMDAYLTKPIDCKLMVSTILSLTKLQPNSHIISCSEQSIT
ncbi:histidine kinase 1-like protein [Tanacetum coccineum]